MKILIYVPNFMFDGDSGEFVHVRELAQNLAKLGHKVAVICKLRDEGLTGSVTIRRVRAPGIRVIGSLWANIHGLFLGALATRGRKYDLVYTRAGFSAGAYLLSRIAKVPYVTEVNGLLWDEIRTARKSWVSRAPGYLLNLIEGEACRRSYHLVAVTPGIKDALVAELGIRPDNVTVIPNGANTDLFRPGDIMQARAQLDFAVPEYLVTFAGSLKAWHGIEYLIKSIPYVLSQCPQSRFLIVGDGPMKQELRELARKVGASSEIIFTGSIPYETVPLYVNASDVCVAPFIRARNERCGSSSLKIHEYMACGRPVVASRIANLELIEQSNAGILVEPENPRELAAAVVNLLKDEKLRGQMGENGRKYVVEHHSWESVAIQVVTVCQESLKRIRLR